MYTQGYYELMINNFKVKACEYLDTCHGYLDKLVSNYATGYFKDNLPFFINGVSTFLPKELLLNHTFSTSINVIDDYDGNVINVYVRVYCGKEWSTRIVFGSSIDYQGIYDALLNIFETFIKDRMINTNLVKINSVWKELTTDSNRDYTITFISKMIPVVVYEISDENVTFNLTSDMVFRIADSILYKDLDSLNGLDTTVFDKEYQEILYTLQSLDTTPELVAARITSLMSMMSYGGIRPYRMIEGTCHKIPYKSKRFSTKHATRVYYRDGKNLCIFDVQGDDVTQVLRTFDITTYKPVDVDMINKYKEVSE
jgi:hypothetical protein